MARQYVTQNGVVLIIPGAYPNLTVQNTVSGLSTNGVLALIGEADAGPDFSEEESLKNNAFGPNSLGDVIAKYRSGPLVDAFRGASAAANDPNLPGSPSRFVMVKTNPSTKAEADLFSQVDGVTAYAVLADKSYGKLGNLLYFSITEDTAEVIPTTGSFTFIPAVGAVDFSIRTNGGASLAVSLLANATPTTFVSTVNALSGVAATGGSLRTVLPGVSGNLSVAVASLVVTITYTGTFTTTPSVGDTLTIPTGSVIAGTGDDNVGAYVVTAATSTTITATKKSDAGQGGAVIGVITPPVAVGSTPVAATTDINVYAPCVITQETSTLINGLGKTLEINALTSAADILTNCLFALSPTAVTWVSTSATPKRLTSAAERSITINVNRQFDAIEEELSAGGQIGLELGYTGTTCAVSVTSTALNTTVVGGSGANLAITLADFATLADLATYINAQTGYTCSVGNNALGQMPAIALDEGSFTAGTTFGNKTCRIKLDAAKLFDAISESGTVQLNVPPEAAVSGLPANASTTFLAGGTKAGTTNAIFQSALDALESVRLNFVVPLFSRDASADIIDGDTDSTSTYTIDYINAAVKTHVLRMSTTKRRRYRQGWLSIRADFDDVKEQSYSLATARCTLAFQDIKDLGASSIEQYQPWMGAAKGASMQAAGLYRSITNKGINCSGAVQAAGDWSDSNDDDLEEALLANLLTVKTDEIAGGFKWVSDQTTYGRDNSFFWNSAQMIYTADVLQLTVAQRMEQAFVGASIADVNAATALSYLEGVMAEMLRIKLISPSDDAPLGYRSPKIQIIGNAMLVSAEVKISGAILFIPIEFLVTQITQTASASQ